MTNMSEERENRIGIKGVSLSQEIVLEIGKFSVLWNVFENDICGNACNNKKLLKKAQTITWVSITPRMV